MSTTDELSAGYWAAIAQRRLAVQRCARCRRWYHPPVLWCPACRSRDLAFEDVSGLGTVHQRVIVRRAMLVEFEASVPYVAATIELAEQPGLFLVANIVGQPPDQVEIGQPVRVIFEEAGDGVVLAQFTPHEDRP